MTTPTPTVRRTTLWTAAFVTVPILGLGYQLCAEHTAGALLGVPFGVAWIVRAAAEPWARGLVALEIMSFAAWMYVLSKAELSAAFPLTAVSYLLVIALGWFGFHEAVTLPQILGAVAILAGVWLLRPEPEPAP
jgi:multidrug transporter EmrE-like cation transporter